MLLQFLLVFHVMGAMLWFGGTMSVPRRVRVALASEIVAARAQLDGLAREGRMMAGATLVVFITGVSLIMERGGFAGLPPRFHVALLLSLVWVVLGATAVRSCLDKLVEMAQADTIAPEVHQMGKRLSMFTGIQHALFTAVTVLMLWRLG